MLSIVMPAYNEEKMVAKAFEVMQDIMNRENIDFELIYVDDGSKDKTWDEISSVCEKNKNAVGVHFSRNFGKEAAILAGLANAEGDCVIVMDCDLQHPPEVTVDMYHLWQDGFEIVEGVKRTRGKESLLHKMCAGMFYKLMSSSVKVDMRRASDFKLLDRKVVDVLLSMQERNSFFRALSTWIGFNKTQIEFDVADRTEGESKWSTRSLVKYAINNIVSFTSAPLAFVAAMGGVCFLGSVILAIQTLVRYAKGMNVEGFTTVILLILFVGSMIMISLGIIGYYIAKIYEEVKLRPRYIISKITRR